MFVLVGFFVSDSTNRDIAQSQQGQSQVQDDVDEAGELFVNGILARGIYKKGEV